VSHPAGSARRRPGDVDWQAAADGIANMIEVLRGMHAALVADGYTGQQARDMVAALVVASTPRR
jgi:hypothetical protein